MKMITKLLTVIISVMLMVFTGCQKSSDGIEIPNNPSPTIPTGALNGLFTINENGDQVYFSQGNLQYQASTDTWRFAEHQWNFIGSDEVSYGEPGGNVEGSSNHLISDMYDGWIDMFNWGTGNNPTYTWGIYGTVFNDWGCNAISNGGNMENIWRTLTKDEWVYIFKTRSTGSGIRYAMAVVNGINGVILLPDDWCISYYSLTSYNNNSASFNSNVISLSVWNAKLEPNGAIFLPAAGFRFGTNVERIGTDGCYWSTALYHVDFSDSWLHPAYPSCPDGLDRFGFSVRLVCSADN